MLEVRALFVQYGPLEVLSGVDLHVDAGEMVALIGPNGAGKSTLMNCLSGIVAASSGTVRIDGTFAHVPEGRQLFGGLSVEDNLQLGAWKAKRQDRNTGWIFDLLPELLPFRHALAQNLSGGQQQMVAIGRALMARPDILAVDELSLGLAPLVVERLVAALREINRMHGMAILLVEQNARTALSLCHRAHVIGGGKVVATETSEQLASGTTLQDSYLGEAAGARR